MKVKKCFLRFGLVAVAGVFLVSAAGGGSTGCGFLCDDDDCVIGTPDDDSSAAGSVNTGSTEATEGSTADALVRELCAAAVRCDSSLTESGCRAAMNGEGGRQIWDDFGLEAAENEFTTAEVKARIADGTVAVNESAAADCLHELIEVCDSEGESFFIGSYENAENLILEDGACPSVLAEGGAS